MMNKVEKVANAITEKAVPTDAGLDIIRDSVWGIFHTIGTIVEWIDWSLLAGAGEVPLLLAVAVFMWFTFNKGTLIGFLVIEIGLITLGGTPLTSMLVNMTEHPYAALWLPFLIHYNKKDSNEIMGFALNFVFLADVFTGFSLHPLYIIALTAGAIIGTTDGKATVNVAYMDR